MKGKKSPVWFEYLPLVRGSKAIKVGSPMEGARLAIREQPELTIRTRTSRARSSR